MAHQHKLSCLKIRPGGQILCSITGDLFSESDSSWRRHHPGEKRWKKRLNLACPHGLQVWVVNGTYIRNHYDSDFVQGNGSYSRFIPKGEIWIDCSVRASEWLHMILHECVLAAKLEEGSDFDMAYDVAKKAEESARRARSR